MAYCAGRKKPRGPCTKGMTGGPDLGRLRSLHSNCRLPVSALLQHSPREHVPGVVF